MAGGKGGVCAKKRVEWCIPLIYSAFVKKEMQSRACGTTLGLYSFPPHIFPNDNCKKEENFLIMHFFAIFVLWCTILSIARSNETPLCCFEVVGGYSKSRNREKATLLHPSHKFLLLPPS